MAYEAGKVIWDSGKVKSGNSVLIPYSGQTLKSFGHYEWKVRAWDEKGAQDEHVRQSAEMARRLKKDGMPVIVSCWFPPKWAGEQTTRSNGYDRAWHLKAEQTDRIYASLFSYLDFLKRDYGVEADYFSFNESDLGIDVVMSPQEHCHFIKSFGAYLAQRDMKTLLLLGDNSDATTFDFILPALHDPAARRYIGAISFHSWRGCDDVTLGKWAAAAREINVPPGDFASLNLGSNRGDDEENVRENYTRLCALTQPLSILQWQLTADYSLLWGAGIFRSEGPLRPTQRFFNLKQLSLTPAYAFFVPTVCGKQDVNVAAFHKASTGQLAIHIVNNAASCQAHITGLPANMSRATVYITNRRQQAEEQTVQLAGGEASIEMPAESFVTVIAE